jgi:hypothetical protein
MQQPIRKPCPWRMPQDATRDVRVHHVGLFVSLLFESLLNEFMPLIAKRFPHLGFTGDDQCKFAVAILHLVQKVAAFVL